MAPDDDLFLADETVLAVDIAEADNTADDNSEADNAEADNSEADNAKADASEAVPVADLIMAASESLLVFVFSISSSFVGSLPAQIVDSLDEYNE